MAAPGRDQCNSVEPEVDRYSTVIPAERSESRDPCGLTVTRTDRMGPGSAPLRGLAGMTE